MTEVVPPWWLIVSAIFFVLATVAMIGIVVALIKVLQMLGEIMPQVKATAVRVEEVATRVEEVSETVKKTVEDLSSRARGIATTTEGMVNKTAGVVASQSPWIVGVVTAIKLYKAFQEMRETKATSQATNPTPKSGHPKPFPIPLIRPRLDLGPIFGHNIQVAAGWSSLVARRAHNPEVASSNLAPAPKMCKGPPKGGLFVFGGRASGASFRVNPGALRHRR